MNAPGGGRARAAVSVVVVSYNTRDLLARCLESIRAESASIAVEVWVVDNASADGSADLVSSQFPEVHLVRNDHNAGFAAANNQALRQARGELLLLLNSDAYLRPGSLDAFIEAFDRHPEMGIAGASLWNADGSPQPSWGDFPRPWVEFLFQSLLFKVWPSPFPYGRRVHPLLRRAYRRFQWVDWVTGAALMMRRRVWETIGGLPEETFMYGEDMAYCARARAAGFRVGYLPEARVEHRLAGSRSNYGDWIESYTRATLEYYRRHGRAGDLARVALLVRMGSLWRRALWTVVGHLRPGARAEAAMRRAGYRRAAALARDYSRGTAGGGKT